VVWTCKRIQQPPGNTVAVIPRRWSAPPGSARRGAPFNQFGSPHVAVDISWGCVLEESEEAYRVERPFQRSATTGGRLSTVSRRQLRGPNGRATGRIEWELWQSFKRDGDERAREALITRFLPLARAIARPYQSAGVPFEDLVQVANVGLVCAVDRFDPDRGLAFSTFATQVIQGELKRELAKSGWAVHIPRRLQQLVQRIRRSNDTLTGRLGRSPTAAELAVESELSVEEVREGMRVELAKISQTEYLGRRATGRRRGDTERNVDERFAIVEEASTLARALATLSPRERRVLHLSLVEERAQHEIAGEFGISQRQVSRIARRAIERMQVVAWQGASTRNGSNDQ
jgi:RNA polymerase sigma-B factor